MTKDLEPSDLQLVQSFVSGDNVSFDRLVGRHGRAVYSFIYRFLGTDPHVDDVYQDVWLRVFKSLARFGGRSRFTTWLFQVTRNICIDHLRRRKRRGRMMSIDDTSGRNEEGGPFKDQIPGREVDAEKLAENRELWQHVERAIAELPENQREVFLLREQTALTFEEISEMSGVPRNTVKSRMRYALENIRGYMKRRNILKEVMTHG